MAKFLQDAIEEMAVSKKIQSKDTAQSLVAFFQDVKILIFFMMDKIILSLHCFTTTNCVWLLFWYI